MWEKLFGIASLPPDDAPGKSGVHSVRQVASITLVVLSAQITPLAAVLVEGKDLSTPTRILLLVGLAVGELFLILVTALCISQLRFELAVRRRDLQGQLRHAAPVEATRTEVHARTRTAATPRAPRRSGTRPARRTGQGS